MWTVGRGDRVEALWFRSGGTKVRFWDVFHLLASSCPVGAPSNVRAPDGPHTPLAFPHTNVCVAAVAASLCLLAVTRAPLCARTTEEAAVAGNLLVVAPSRGGSGEVDCRQGLVRGAVPGAYVILAVRSDPDSRLTRWRLSCVG